MRGSYAALWTPRWLIESFVDFEIPDELDEYAKITTDQKKKVLGLNAAKMYDIPVPAELQIPSADEPAVGPRGADALVGAYLMASDAKDALKDLPWARCVVVELDDHHDSGIINAGLAADAGYRGTFGHEADEAAPPRSGISYRAWRFGDG